MKYRGVVLIFTLFLVFGSAAVARGQSAMRSYVPKNGFVPDGQTAIRVAEAILAPIYGEKQVASEHPLSAELKGDVWTVLGSLPKGSTGGVAQVKISKKTGQILSVTHGK